MCAPGGVAPPLFLSRPSLLSSLWFLLPPPQYALDFLSAKGPQLTRVQLNTTENCIRAVASGAADALLEEEAVLNWYLKTMPGLSRGIVVAGRVVNTKKHYFGAPVLAIPNSRRQAAPVLAGGTHLVSRLGSR